MSILFFDELPTMDRSYLATAFTDHVGTVARPFNYLDRYTIVQCRACGRHWQRIDWGCALHVFTCRARLEDQIHPLPAVVK